MKAPSRNASRRVDGRKPDQLRPVEIVRGYTKFAPGSVLIRSGDTAVLCSATVEETVPEWMKGKGRGWLTAEYDMLPGSTGKRRPRSRAKVDGRASEIQRLVGRCLRAVVDMNTLGERTIWIDCDVLQADGGTRTAAITGAYVALMDAVRSLMGRGLLKASPVREPVAAISVGKVDGRVLLDLNYTEDVRAEADFNIAMTGRGQFVEVQGSAEAGTFSAPELSEVLRLASSGIRKLMLAQKRALAT
jgi:ribonuclease PH